MESPHWIDLVLGWVIEKRKATTKVVLRSDRWVDTTVPFSPRSRVKSIFFGLQKKLPLAVTFFSAEKHAAKPPHSPRNSPQTHHQNTTFFVPLFAKTPAKTPLHHTNKKIPPRKSTAPYFAAV
jgi:hypothetical protein